MVYIALQDLGLHLYEQLKIAFEMGIIIDGGTDMEKSGTFV